MKSYCYNNCQKGTSNVPLYNSPRCVERIALCFEKTSFILSFRVSHVRILIVDEKCLESISRRVLGKIIYSKTFLSSQEILVILENECVCVSSSSIRIYLCNREI